VAKQISKLVMVTPFKSSITTLSEEEQLLMLKGCVLCQITRDVDAGSTRSKAEWRSCKAELGLPIEVLTVDTVPQHVAIVMGRPPVVCAVLEDESVVALLDGPSLARCRGSVADFRGRLLYRIAALDLAI
jgi:hypothetical protein